MKASKLRKVLNLLIKIVILILSWWYIYYQIGQKSDFFDDFSALSSMILSTEGIWIMVVVLLMMLLNWSIESMKWKFLIAKTEKISFSTSLKAVFSGVTVSTFTPNRIGEYFGRVFILKNTNPWQGTFMTMVGSISQMMVTVTLGVFAIIRFVYLFTSWDNYISPLLFWILTVVLILLTVILLLFYFNIRLLQPFFGRFTKKKRVRFREHLKAFAFYSSPDLARVILYSFARYAVFTTQYFLLLHLFQVPISFLDGITLISCVYLFMVAVPSIALSEMGIRGSLALFFFGIYYSGNFLIDDAVQSGAVMASFMIWIINLVIPSLIGGVFIFQLKFFRNK